MKITLEIMFSLVAGFGLTFLAVWFVSLNPYIFEWDAFGRAMYLWLSLLLSIFFAALATRFVSLKDI